MGRIRSFALVATALFASGLAALSSQAQTISTIAGGGPCAGPALTAPMPVINAVAIDAAGNTYVTLYGKHVICRIGAATGMITKIAGTGYLQANTTGGYDGDNSYAFYATLNLGNGANALAFDAAGNLYFADLGNHRIRKINFASGFITTVAGNGTPAFAGDGGAATAASLNVPAGIAIQNGTLYIADQNNCRVRRVVLATGIIDTIAGNGSCTPSGDGGLANAAGLFPTNLTIAPDGAIYVGTIEDAGTHGRVRKLSPLAGVTVYSISTVAGGGATTDPDFTGSPTALRLEPLRALAIDTDGGLLISNNASSLELIRKISAPIATGTIHRVAGSTRCQAALGDGGAAASASFCGIRSIAVDAAGNLLVSDQLNNRLRKVSKATGLASTVAGANAGVAHGTVNFTYEFVPAVVAPLYFPTAVARDAGGNLFIAETEGHRVRRVDAVTGNISPFAGTSVGGNNGTGLAAVATQLQAPQGVAVHSSGAVYVADTQNNCIRRIDPVTNVATIVAGEAGTVGSSGDGGPAAQALLNMPMGLVFVGDVLYIADNGNNRVRRISAQGTITTVAGGGVAIVGDGGPATAAALQSPRTVALDAAGNLFIPEYNAHRVRKVTPAGVISTVAGTAVAGDTGDGGLATAAKITQPSGVAIDLAGNLHISEVDRVRTVAAGTGIITTTAGPGTTAYPGDGGPAVNAIIRFPLGVAIAADGHLLVVEAAGNTIRKIRLPSALVGTDDEDNDGIPNAVEAPETRNPFVKDNDVFGNARLFAMQQYRDFLRREGDAGGIQYYTGLITNGQALRGNVIESFFASPEFSGTASPVARLYFATFLRVPDYAGLIFQIDAFRAGAPLDVIAGNFTASPEFQARYGTLTNAQFVALLYTNILERTAAQGEIDYHVNVLNGGATRGQVLVGFSESPEYIGKVAHDVYVTMMYVGMLRRAPDPGGFTYWVDYMDAGNSGLALILGFLNSPEYHTRFLP